MLQWRLVPPWLARAWPVWALIPFGGLHGLLLTYLPLNSDLVNKCFGAALQIAGGTLVLYSINDNLGLFRQQSLLSGVVVWVKSIPIRRPPVTLSAAGSATASTSATASLSVGRTVTTLDERVAELERKLVEFADQHRRDLSTVMEKVSNHRAELERMISATSEQVITLGKRLEHSAVGGFKFQFFGVGLAIYGAITSVFA